MERFLGLEFLPFTPERRGCIDALLEASPQALSGYTTATLMAWDPMFDYRYARPPGHDGEETLLISFANAAGERHLMQPVGPFPPAFSRALLDRSAALPYPLQLHYVTKDFVDRHPELAEGMGVVEDRASSNYIYGVEDLAELKGGKFAPKRNLISQANASYAWSAGPLLPGDVEACIALTDALNQEMGETLVGLPLFEYRALIYTLQNFEALRQRGTKIVIDGKVEAFALWEPLTPAMAGIHFERAHRSFKGLYQVVNRETARAIRSEGFTLINREEDVGDEGLRKAKLSYQPVEIAPAYTLTVKR